MMLPSTHPIESDYSHGEVARQVKLILAHDLFSNSPVLSNFLKFIVEETLAGKLTSLKEYTIGVTGLGKRVDFNPQIDASVRIHAGRLRRLLTDYYSGPGSGDKILIEMVKGSYVPAFRQRCVAQEMPKIVSLSLEEIKHVTLSKITVAILPFRNLSPGADHQVLVDCLGEEFTYAFGNAGEFSVIGHLSTLKLALQHTQLHIIGRKLHAQYIVTGTVMRSGNVFRVHVGLMESHNGTQVWTRAFEYSTNQELTEILDPTVQAVYDVLCGPFGVIIRHAAGASQSTVEDSIEFDPSLWNYNFHTNFSFFTYAKTRRALEIVKQNDPQFATVLAMLSELYVWGHLLGYPTVDQPVAISLQLAHKAMNLDPQSGQACFSYFWASLCNHGRAATPDEIDRFLSVHASSPADHGKYGMALIFAGHYTQGRALLEPYMRHHPVYPWTFDLALALLHFRDHRHAEALDSLEKIDATDVYVVDVMKAVLLAELGLQQEARALFDSLMENFPSIIANLRSYLSLLLHDDALVDQIFTCAQRCRSESATHS